jgi:hypothetical protein
MRNFLGGLLLGALATYWCLTNAERVRATMHDLWERASSAPPATAPKARPR